MPSMHRLTAAALLLLPGAAAHGQAAATPEQRAPGRGTAAYAACLDRAGGVTPAMVQCSNEEAGRWDRRLNAAYGGIMRDPGWNAETKALLRDAQRAWIAYRDRSCAAQGELAAEGGTLSRIIAADCVARLTADRAAELEETQRGAAGR
jgi:uncharacterized protein YecT (DUF1311 family)